MQFPSALSLNPVYNFFRTLSTKFTPLIMAKATKVTAAAVPAVDKRANKSKKEGKKAAPAPAPAAAPVKVRSSTYVIMV